MGNVVIKDRRRRNPLKADALHNAILESVGFSSIATDEKGLVQVFSAGARRMLGYEEADVVNKLTPADFSDPLQASTVATGFEALVWKARGMEDQYELTFIRKDGTRLPCIVCVSALHESGGDIVGYLFMAIDNTAQQGFRRMVESVTDCGIVQLDAQGQVLSWNAGAQILDGYSAHEIVGKPGAPELDLAAAAAMGRHETQGWRSRKDGSRYCANIVLTSIYDAGGVLRGFARLVRDVTQGRSEPQPDLPAAVAVPKPAALERCAQLLYVEDDPASFALVEQQVAGRADVQLLRASHVGLGIERARAAPPDVILLNVDLPGISAAEFMKRLRADPATQNTPILALGANGAPEAIAKALHAGFFHYLARPLKGGLFMEALGDALEFAARERDEQNDRAFTSAHSH